MKPLYLNQVYPENQQKVNSNKRRHRVPEQGFLRLVSELYHSKPRSDWTEKCSYQQALFRNAPFFLSCFVFIHPVKGKRNCVKDDINEREKKVNRTCHEKEISFIIIKGCDVR